MSQVTPKFYIRDLCIYSSNPNNIHGRKVCRILGIKPFAEWKNKTTPEYITHFLVENEKREVGETDLEEI